MTTSRFTAFLASLLVAIAAASCGASAPARFYTLDSKAVASGAPPTGDANARNAGIVIGLVSVPSAVDRPQFVVQVAPNRVEIDEFNRWAAPLNETIAATVATDLSVLLGTPNVATAPRANLDPAYRVTIDVQRFDSIPGEAAVLEAVWSVSRTKDSLTRSGRTTAHERVEGKGFDELVAAHSRALTRLSQDIAAAIRASAVATSR